MMKNKKLFFFLSEKTSFSGINWSRPLMIDNIIIVEIGYHLARVSISVRELGKVPDYFREVVGEGFRVSVSRIRVSENDPGCQFPDEFGFQKMIQVSVPRQIRAWDRLFGSRLIIIISPEHNS